MDTVFGISVDKHFKSSAALRERVKMPSDLASKKVIDRIDDLSQRFIAASSLAFISSTRPDGVQDVTPRGGPPGFVHVLNENLIAFPDLAGNNRMDTFENVMDNPNVGIIFVIPGHSDTLRVSGKGAVVQAADLAQLMTPHGEAAELSLLVKVERVLCHCPKAFARGKVWQPDEWPDTADVPTGRDMTIAHVAMGET